MATKKKPNKRSARKPATNAKPARRKSVSKPATKSAGNRRTADLASRSGARKKASGRRIQNTPSSVSNAVKVSGTDRELLTLLQADGRMSNLALAKAVGLSPAACHDRVRKLIAQGLVRHFSGHLNAEALDAGLVVFTTIQLDRSKTAVLQHLTDAVMASPAIMECHLITGASDVLLKVRVQDLPSYQHLLDTVIFPISGVRSVSSHASLQTIKETSAIPL